MSESEEEYKGVYKLDNTPIKFVISKDTNHGKEPIFFILFRDSDLERLNKIQIVFGGNGIYGHDGSYLLFLHINDNSFKQLKTIITTGSSPQSGLKSTDPEYNIMNHPGEWMNEKKGGPAITEYEKSKAEAKAAEAAEAKAAEAAEAAKKKRRWPWQRSKTGGGIRSKPTKRRRNRRGNRKTKKI